MTIAQDKPDTIANISLDASSGAAPAPEATVAAHSSRRRFIGASAASRGPPAIRPSRST
jgi:hypothetical protein